jgi:hypothetical protein
MHLLLGSCLIRYASVKSRRCFALQLIVDGDCFMVGLLGYYDSDL